jgi:hypothetical protein
MILRGRMAIHAIVQTFHVAVGWARRTYGTELRFLPSAALRGGELEHGVKREGNRRASFDRRAPEICDQHLKNTDVADNEDWTNLLFDVHHDRFETASQIAIAFAAREPGVKRVLHELLVPLGMHIGNVLQF